MNDFFFADLFNAVGHLGVSKAKQHRLLRDCGFVFCNQAMHVTQKIVRLDVPNPSQ